MTWNPKWEAAHKAKDWGRYPSEQLVRWTFQTFGLPFAERHGVKILDLGCGQGAATLFLAREGFHVSAVDGSPSAIKKLAGRLHDDGLIAYLYTEEMSKTGFHNGRFDGLVDIVSLAHNENPENIVNEMHRVLRPGGKLFSVIPSKGTWKKPFEQYGPVQFLDAKEISDLFGRWFTLSIGWVKEYTHTGKLLEHWIVSGTKI